MTNKAQTHEQILSEIKYIKNHFGFTLSRLSQLAEMNYTTFQNCYGNNSRNVFKKVNLLKLKVNLHKLIKNYSIDSVN